MQAPGGIESAQSHRFSLGGVDGSGAASISVNTSLALLRCNRRATSAPIPLAAPVMKATFY